MSSVANVRCSGVGGVSLAAGPLSTSTTTARASITTTSNSSAASILLGRGVAAHLTECLIRALDGHRGGVHLTVAEGELLQERVMAENRVGSIAVLARPVFEYLGDGTS